MTLAKVQGRIFYFAPLESTEYVIFFLAVLFCFCFEQNRTEQRSFQRKQVVDDEKVGVGFALQYNI
jgi:hypothetical protein